MTKKTRFHILCAYTDDILFEGWFSSQKECVETAVAEHINLDGADLTGINLANANLDDAQMAGVILNGANLNGANLSECVFDNAQMVGADLSHACFALSSLMNVDMTAASFSATEVIDAVISGCRFSCPSVFGTAFHKAAVFKGCRFIHDTKGDFIMDKPPVIIQGLTRDIVYLDHIIKVGSEFIAKGDLIATGDRHLEFLYGREIASFLRPVLYETMASL